MKWFLFVLALASVASPFLFAATPSTQPSLQDENRRLRDIVADQDLQIRALKDQLSRKEKELRDLRQRIPTIVVPPMNQARPPMPVPEYFAPPGWTPEQTPPKGWVPVPFNGSNYYLIPVSEQAHPVGTAAPYRQTPTIAPAAPVVPEGSLISGGK